MKKKAILIALGAIAILTGASVWEGTAAVAASGTLPDGGFFVATNSFPLNTVIDVKNLENEKSVRVVVAATLSSPGLLISLSREAGTALGLDAGRVGRVRISVPADPIAFSRFTEGLVASADPDMNPQAAVAMSAREQDKISQPAAAKTVVPTETKPAGEEKTGDTAVATDESAAGTTGSQMNSPAQPSAQTAVTPPSPAGENAVPLESETQSPAEVATVEGPSLDPASTSETIAAEQPPANAVLERPMDLDEAFGAPEVSDGAKKSEVMEAPPEVAEQGSFVRESSPLDLDLPAPKTDLASKGTPSESDVVDVDSGILVQPIPVPLVASVAEPKPAIEVPSDGVPLSAGVEAASSASLYDASAPENETKVVDVGEVPEEPAESDIGAVDLTEAKPFVDSPEVTPAPSVVEEPADEPQPSEVASMTEEPEIAPVETTEPEAKVASVVPEVTESTEPMETSPVEPSVTFAPVPTADKVTEPMPAPAIPDPKTTELSLVPADERPPEAEPQSDEPIGPFAEPVVVAQGSAEEPNREEAPDSTSGIEAPDGPFVAPIELATPKENLDEAPSPAISGPFVDAPEVALAPEVAPLASPVVAPEPKPADTLSVDLSGDEPAPFVEAPTPLAVPPTSESATQLGPMAPEIAAAQEPAAPAPEEPSERVEAAAIEATIDSLLLDRLEQGKYYLQLGAYKNLVSLKDLLGAIDSRFPIAVEKDGGNQVFRVLVGPVNLGESGALTLRLKNAGYKDVFLRKGI